MTIVFLKVFDDKRKLKIKGNEFLIYVESRSYPNDALDSIIWSKTHTLLLDLAYYI